MYYNFMVRDCDKKIKSNVIKYLSKFTLFIILVSDIVEKKRQNVIEDKINYSCVIYIKENKAD